MKSKLAYGLALVSVFLLLASIEASADIVTNRSGIAPDVETFESPPPPADPGISESIVTGFGKFSGGMVHVLHIPEFYASPPNAYDIGKFAELELSVPVSAVKFFYVHGKGTATGDSTDLLTGESHKINKGEATAWNGKKKLGKVKSTKALPFAGFGPDENFVTLGPFKKLITRITFGKGKIDNFEIIPPPASAPPATRQVRKLALTWGTIKKDIK